jgi:glycosyltransferase involved in cell wall biosynthesis
MNLTVIILTFNSAQSVGAVIESSRSLAKRILVVDSGSQDGTQALVESLGAEVLEHPFEHYAAQRNWAQEQANLQPDDWVLHLDSDEELSPELAASIKAALKNPQADGYLMRRLTHFWGKPIRFGHMNPSWHMRLFRAGKGRCEDRLYDQHFVCDGPTQKLKGVLLDRQNIDLERWTATHNRWSTMEAIEGTSIRTDRSGQLKESLFGDRRERKRWIKNRLWYRAPLFLRTYIFFFYSYILKLGFLDGRVGLVYHTLQAFWFRFLVDAKIKERERAK